MEFGVSSQLVCQAARLVSILFPSVLGLISSREISVHDSFTPVDILYPTKQPTWKKLATAFVHFPLKSDCTARAIFRRLVSLCLCFPNTWIFRNLKLLFALSTIAAAG